jgi:hypothetical protein
MTLNRDGETGIQLVFSLAASPFMSLDISHLLRVP